MDWDDLRIFLQLVRTGRMAGAGRALGLDDTTVGRRVARLEREVGAPLVTRAGRRTLITEEGQKLAQAAEVMAAHPAALQLRLLQTVVEVAAEKNSTLVLPFPVELLRFLERSTPAEPATTEEPAAPVPELPDPRVATVLNGR